MKRIAVLTSGGDAPGMNAAIPAVVGGRGVKSLVVYTPRLTVGGSSRPAFGVLSSARDLFSSAHAELTVE